MSFSYDKFLRPLTSTDNEIRIFDNDGNLVYNINPYQISSSIVSGNLIKINFRKGKVISIPFSSLNEAKLAIVSFQSQADELAAKEPIFIDQQVKNYVDSINNVGLLSSVSDEFTCDVSINMIWYATASATYSIDFINVPIIDNRIVNATIILSGDANLDVIKIDGETQSCLQSGSASDDVSVFNFKFLRVNSSWEQILCRIDPY